MPIIPTGNSSPSVTCRPVFITGPRKQVGKLHRLLLLLAPAAADVPAKADAAAFRARPVCPSEES